MPRKPKRPCSYPGCPNLTDGRFCPEHEKKEAKRYEKYDRDPNTKRRYGRAWKRIRDSYADAHPLCEMCLENGVYTTTEQIHHVKPLSQGGTHDRENLMALCKCGTRRPLAQPVGAVYFSTVKSPGNGRGGSRTKSQFQTGYIGP